MGWLGGIIASVLTNLGARFAAWLVTFLSRAFKRRNDDKEIDDRAEESVKPVEDVIKEPIPAQDDKEALEKRKEALREAAKSILG